MVAKQPMNINMSINTTVREISLFIISSLFILGLSDVIQN